MVPFQEARLGKVTASVASLCSYTENEAGGSA